MDRMFTRQIVGSVATYPARFDRLHEMVASVAPQLDHLVIYVNGTTDGLPDMSDMANVHILDGRDYAGDLSARGKVYPLKFMHDCEVFTLDDDFVYPADYVARNLATLRQFQGACVVTTHGGILPVHVDWYYDRTAVLASVEAVDHLQICAVAGSGTLCFDQRHLALNLPDLLAETMVDLRISLAARGAGLPIFVLPRQAGWLQSFGLDGLWHDFKDAGLTPHTYVAREYNWGFDIYADIVRHAFAKAGITPDHAGLDPELTACLKSGDIPSIWRASVLTMRKRADYLGLFS